MPDVRDKDVQDRGGVNRAFAPQAACALYSEGPHILWGRFAEAATT